MEGFQSRGVDQEPDGYSERASALFCGEICAALHQSGLYGRAGMSNPSPRELPSAAFRCILVLKHLNQMNGLLLGLCQTWWHAEKVIQPFDAAVLE